MQFIRDIYAAKRAASRPACAAEASTPAGAGIVADRKSETESADTPARRRPVISFEFFPPKTDEGDRALLEKHIPALLGGKAGFLFRHLRRRRRHARQNAEDRGSHPAAARTDRAGASDLRQPHARRGDGAAGKNPARLVAKTSSPCAATRPAAANFKPRPAALNLPRNWSNSSANKMGFPSASPDFPKATSPTKPASMTTGGI